MPGQIMASLEAHHLKTAFDASPVAFAYYDPGDRLRFWNHAYEDLNFAIRPLIREGAYFPDLLTELIVRGQIDIPGGDWTTWLHERVEIRRQGATAFRRLGDGRTFLVQERKDEIGGTLGFWLDITDFVAVGGLRIEGGGRIGGAAPTLGDHGLQDMIRTDLQVIMGNLELLRDPEAGEDRGALIDAAFVAGQAIANLLEDARNPDRQPAGSEARATAR